MPAYQCIPIDLLALTKHFISTDVWSGEWFLFHAQDRERLEYLRDHGFSHIVMIDTNLSREDFDEIVEPVTTGPWTKAIEVLSNGQYKFRVMSAFANPADAVMARMVVEE